MSKVLRPSNDQQEIARLKQRVAALERVQAQIPYLEIAQGSSESIAATTKSTFSDWSFNYTNDDDTVFDTTVKDAIKVVKSGALLVKGSAYGNAGTASYVQVEMEIYDSGNSLIAGPYGGARQIRMNYEVSADFATPNYRRYWIDALFLHSWDDAGGDYAKFTLKFKNATGGSVTISDGEMVAVWIGNAGGSRDLSPF